MTFIEKIIEPKLQIDSSRKIFTNQMLMAMIFPLFAEQFFILLVGIADTMMISYAGEAAVSGVSLDNMFITIFLFMFSALASGGAVIVSQYVGKKDQESGQNAAGKLVSIAAMFSFGSMVLVLLFGRQILNLLFGSVDPKVMEACVTYLRITAYSLPAIAIYNAGSAILRSMGKTKPIMHISIIANIINVIGNAIGIFILHAGVAGVAWPSLIARTFSAIVMMVICFNKKQVIYLKMREIFSTDWAMVKKILNIAVPASFEGGVFQMVKVALGTITALFGTSQIAANGIAQAFWSMAALVSIALGPAYVTVVGQAMGAKDPEAADYYMIKLTKISYAAAIFWNGLLLILVPIILRFYDLPSETKNLIIILVIIHNIFSALVSPIGMTFSSGLRAAGDVRYTVMVSILSTLVVRVLLSIFFGIVLNLGVIGIAIAMVTDWTVRAIFIQRRYSSGIWKQFELV